MISRSTTNVLSVLILTSAPVYAQGTSLDFNDNQLPAGWTLHATTANTNFGFANGRFFAAQSDSGAYIERAIGDDASTSEISIGWEGSVFQTYWGNFSGVNLKDTAGTLFSTSIGSASYSWGTGIQVLIRAGTAENSWILPLSHGSYSFRSTFSNGSIVFTGSLNGNEVFSKSATVAALDLLSVEAVRLNVYETVGPEMWIDNVSISAVPEVPIYALMLLGVVPLAIMKRRRRGGGA
jgi:hypothetical protein